MAAQAAGLGEDFQEASGDDGGIFGAGEAVEEDDEFIAAEAGGGMRRPRRSARSPERTACGRRPADFLEQEVAGIVAEAVVDVLEAVQVQEEDGEVVLPEAPGAAAPPVGGGPGRAPGWADR